VTTTPPQSLSSTAAAVVTTTISENSTAAGEIATTTTSYPVSSATAMVAVQGIEGCGLNITAGNISLSVERVTGAQAVVFYARLGFPNAPDRGIVARFM
jgi:hypothetical protein